MRKMTKDKELKKLFEAVAAIAEDAPTCAPILPKLDGRVAFIENKIPIIDTRLDREAIRRDDERTAERDLELERQVFGAARPPRKVPQGAVGHQSERGRRNAPKRNATRQRAEKGRKTK